MKNIRSVFSILLSIVLILSFVPLECIAAENNALDDIVEYAVPLVSKEMPENVISFYEVTGDYYLNLRDIAALTRCAYEENGNIILLTQGIRELKINTETCDMNDSGIKEQGKIKLKEYDSTYLCEAVPMLHYLGAECSINNELNAFQVLMPSITFWEAFMPDYLDYHFNTEEWVGNQTDKEISLVCDIIIDLLDITNGHGMFATDEHCEDALYDILNVDIYSHESVQNIVEEENNKLQKFLCSDTFSNAFSQGSEIGQKIFEGYADYYMTAKIAVDEVNRTYQLIKGNYEVAADIGQQINKNVCKQVDLSTIGKNSVGVATMAFDTALNTYKLMCYDEESRTLFSTCITDDVEKFTNYDVEYLQEITDKISSDIMTDQSIVSNVVVDEISKWVSSEIKDKVVEKVLSGFKCGDIYDLAIKVGVILAEIPLRGTIDAFSDDMDMFWLADTQTDIAQLATRYMLTTLRDEKGNNAEHIEMVKNLMALYYRTTIAFCENTISSCEKFGNAKTKAKTCEYLKQVSDYMAKYLYLMTNCKVVAIVEFSELSDNILVSEWIKKFENNFSTPFEKLPNEFIFTMGAGAWATTINLQDDGTFTGEYYDAEYGDTAEGYPKGTIYGCKFNGKFAIHEQLDEYSYSVRIEDWYYQKEPSETSIYYEDGIRHIVTEAYGVDPLDEYTIYVPGASTNHVVSNPAFSIPNTTQPLSIIPSGIYVIYNNNQEISFLGQDNGSPMYGGINAEELHKIYYNFLEKNNFHQYDEWPLGPATEYAILDVNNDGYDELLITNQGDGQNRNLDIYTVNKTTINDHDIVEGPYPIYNDHGIPIYYSSLYYSPSYNRLVRRGIPNYPGIDFWNFMKLDNLIFASDFWLSLEEEYESENEVYILNGDVQRGIDEAEYNSYLTDLVEVEWMKIQSSPY